MLNRLFASRKRPFLAGLNKPQHIEMDISGSKLELDVPAHNDASLPEQQAPLSHFNLYTTTGFRPDNATFSTSGGGYQLFVNDAIKNNVIGL